MTGTILLQTIIFIAAAIVCVPIAKRLGLSAVLGYLFAGILVGPYALEFVGEEGEDILHFAEFGVVIMLFLIGLEIEPTDFWKMRKSILGMGGGQLVLTLPLAYLALILLGVDSNEALVIAMAVVLSSTAIVLQMIKEKGLMATSYGKASFSILLFQDIIVIPMLAIIPLLASSEDNAASSGHDDFYLLEGLPLGVQTLIIILSVVLIILIGRYLVAPVLRWVARTRLRELLIASALLIVFGLAYSMELVGLSPALGAFLGGVVLANSEFKHEIESNLEPFKGILLGLFFMAVGASINFIVIKENPTMIVGLVVGVILLKALVLFIVGIIFRMKMDQKLMLTIGLAQMGEFAFVLFAFAFQLKVLSKEMMDLWLVVTAITMTLAPILGVINERLILPYFGTKEKEEKPPDEIEVANKVILVGYGNFGSIVGRFLRANGVEATVLDHDSNRVDLLRKLGFTVYYGDATRMDLLESAGVETADFLILAINDQDSTVSLAKTLKEEYPNLKLMVRARGHEDAAELFRLGIYNVYRESLQTSVTLAKDVLKGIGIQEDLLDRQVRNFIKYDEEGLRRIVNEIEEGEDYFVKVKTELEHQEELLREDIRRSKDPDFQA